MSDSLVLDSFALFCFFQKEPGWDKVRDTFLCLSSTGQKALFSLMNWGEFYSIVRRRVGRQKAEEALALIEQLPIDILPVDDLLVREAAEIKADYPISYADAFCVATALRHGGRILTGDPEYLSVEALLSVEWLVQAPA